MNRRDQSKPRPVPGIDRIHAAETTAASGQIASAEDVQPSGERVAAPDSERKTLSPADPTEVALFDQVVMVPFRIRELLSNSETEQNKKKSPLDRWVGHLCQPVNGSPGAWEDRGPFFPFDTSCEEPAETRPRATDSAKQSAYDRIRYAEHVYFHPFVRDFLYPTAEDRFHARVAAKGPDAVPGFKNRSLRILDHTKGIRWAAVFVRNTTDEDVDDYTNKPHIDIFLLRIRRVQSYLFETRIGFLAVEFDNRFSASRSTSAQLETFDQKEDAQVFDVHRGDIDNWFPDGEYSGPRVKLLSWFRKLERDDKLKHNDCQPFHYTLVENPDLDQILSLQTMLRRGYPPYWDYDPVLHRSNPSQECSSGKTVESIVWLDRNQMPVFGESEWSSEKLLVPKALVHSPHKLFWSLDWRKRIQETRESGVPPLFPWWRQLLAPMEELNGRTKGEEFSTTELWLHQSLSYPDDQLPKTQKERSGKICYTMFGDDRFPCMTYLAVSDPRKLTTSQWMRLVFADGPGKNASEQPYSRWLWEMTPEAEGNPKLENVCINQQFRREFCYDRFFFRADEAEDKTPDAGIPEAMSTRYLCSGEVFVAVGSSVGQPHEFRMKKDDTMVLKPFALDPVSGLLGHFRYHYFKMGLIAHFHRCSLLNFVEELSIAVSENLGKDPAEDGEDKNFRNMVVRIRRELIKFRFRFWFSEISSQIQARELFTRWSKHLQTQPMFDQVNEQLNEAEEVLTRWAEKKAEEDRRNAKEQQDKADKAQQETERRRNTIFILIAVVGLPATLYGMMASEADSIVRLLFAVVTSILVYISWETRPLLQIIWSLRRILSATNSKDAADVGCPREEDQKPRTANTGRRRIFTGLLALGVFCSGLWVCQRYRTTNSAAGTEIQQEQGSKQKQSGKDHSILNRKVGAPTSPTDTSAAPPPPDPDRVNNKTDDESKSPGSAKTPDAKDAAASKSSNETQPDQLPSGSLKTMPPGLSTDNSVAPKP